MTLGNNPQPLTRRQARELAHGHQSEVTDAVEPASSTPEAVPQPVISAFASPPPAANAGSEHTHALTRRELRAQQAALAAEGAPADFAPAPAGASAPAAVRASRAPSDPRALDIDVVTIPVAPAPVSPRVEFMVEAAPRSKVGKAGKSRPGVLHPPVGHWSLARDEDIDQVPGVSQLEPFDQIVARGISAGGIPTTTNALILPVIPHQGTTSGPLTSTGEIMVTGSIDLPRSLGATGQHPNVYDSSDMDQLLDQLDEVGHHSDVAPVSASRAVSTHASTRGVMAPPSKPGLTLPAVLTITAGVLAFGVLALLVAGYVFRIF